MWMIIAGLLLQALAAPDPAQMEKAPDLGYKAVDHGLRLPPGVTMGAPSGVEITKEGHLIVFNRGAFPLLEFDKDGAFVRSMGEGLYVRPHGFRLDPQGNLWTTDVNGHTVSKLNRQGQVLLTMGVKGQAGEWNEAANSRLLNEPTDLAFGAAGEIFVLQGHGRGEPRVLKFDQTGKLTKSWGGQGTAPGQFDTSHSIVVDAKGLVYVADRQNRRVQIFDGNGKYIKEWKYAGLPCGLYFGPRQQLYMVSGFAGQILKLDANGKALAATGQPGKGLGEFGEAHYMTMGPKGEIWVADTVSSRLHKFVPAALAQQSGGAVPIDDDDIGGVVTSAKGAEAGVWVIAETTNFPTKFRKIVVTDDMGRYVVPDLPRATYALWVRGYGLVDSKPVSARPGQQLNLQAVPAATPQEAAAVYPANYWYSLIKVPDKSEFPGTGPNGNGISPAMRTQADWISQMKDGCQLCHQMGNRATREILKPIAGAHTTAEAWEQRVRAGQRGPQMSAALDRFGRQRAIAMLADWTDRIAKGEVPVQPPRPQGVERNLVLSAWEWGGTRSYIHDEIASDRRNPTIGSRGRVYGVDFTDDALLWVDPIENAAGRVPISVLAPGAPSYIPQRLQVPSPYWGEELIFKNTVHPHNPMMDQRQRVWMTAAVRPPQNPEYCKGGGNPYGRYFPLEQSSRQASMYDPRTGKTMPADTCFSTHHLQFAEDKDNTLYFSGDVNVIGWINTRVFDESGDAARAQGWCPMVVDANGDGRIGEYTQPNQPRDPAKDMRVSGFPYGIIVSPVDGSVWWGNASVPGRIGRLELGSNPPLTCRAEVFEPPFNPPNVITGFTPRGLDVDRNGVIWTALSGGPHMAAFDRRKCKVLNGPTATGQHCPEGWTLYPAPGPQMKGTDLSGSADFTYYNWVDQYDTLGLGANVPIMTGTGSDSLLALQPGTRGFVVLRVPYPLGFYSRGLDGRIDDPKGGWKGRGVWANYGTNLLWHLEGGPGSRSAVVKFQLRPNPLAR